MDAVENLETYLQENNNVSAFKVEVFKGFGHAFAHHPKSVEDRTQSERAMEMALLWLHQYL